MSLYFSHDNTLPLFASKPMGYNAFLLSSDHSTLHIVPFSGSYSSENFMIVVLKCLNSYITINAPFENQYINSLSYEVNIIN